MSAVVSIQTWRFAAAGKHPAAKDFIRLAEGGPFFEGFESWVDGGYKALTAEAGAAPEFCSWRFWSKGAGRDALVCGVIRESSDGVGRPYPFFLIGTGPLRDWEEHWDLLPFACENTWCQLEYLATHRFDDVAKLEAELAGVRPPSGAWQEHAERRKSLNEIGSPLDPYASFLDLRQLGRKAAALAGRAEMFVSLDRGAYVDRILQVSLWHHLFREALKQAPSTLFMGGTLEKACLAAFKRSLAPPDFVQLWSVSSAGLWNNTIGPEHSMDLSSLGKAPVSAERPCGSDVRYDPAFEELQAEVDKLSSPSASGSVNWEKVVRFASDILAHKSKDLVVAGYLAVGLVYTRQHEGLAIGVKLLTDLVGKYWEELYPPRERMRGRLRAMEWWAEKTEAAVRQLPQTPVPAALAAKLAEHTGRLEQFMRRHLDGPPSLAAIREWLCTLCPQEEKAEPETPQARAAPQPAEPVPAAGPVPDAAPSPAAAEPGIRSPQGAQRELESHLQRLREIAGRLWQQDPANPLVYRLNRKSLWLSVESLPPAAGGRTRIPAPTGEVARMLFDLRNTGNAEALLKAAEGRLPQFIFWLDLNRLVAEALARLGNRHLKAHGVVCQETAFLLYRLPGLENLSFADGTPFANPETRNWLKGIALHARPAGEARTDAPPGAVPGEDRIAGEVAEAEALVGQGLLLEALETLQRNLKQASSGRDRILWRLAVSRMLIEARQGKLALPHLEQILRDIDTYRLEEYEPSLTLRGLKLVLSGLESQPEASFKTKTADVLYRIARLDMAEALRLGKYG
ncbi:MAG: type VI secretion system protein TssA [Syntrophaceae bacterium]|nr:type VI secretion system protein TssA [Syntrophaceae bacterium]